VEFTIVNDWENVSDANPEGMAYMFYKKGENKPWRFDFPGKYAGKVSLDVGEYGFVMFNDDTSHVVFENGREGMPFATTRKVEKAFDSLAEDLHESPDMMWSNSIRKIFLKYERLEYTSTSDFFDDNLIINHARYLVTDPRRIIPSYTVKLLNVSNISGVVASKGVITGMASGINLYGGHRSSKSVSVPFDMEIMPDSALVGRFLAFGLPDGRDVKNEIRLYFLLSDGRNLCYIFDRTEEVRVAPDSMNVVLTVDTVPLPYAPPAINGGAFDPSVTGWITIVVNYET